MSKNESPDGALKVAGWGSLPGTAVHASLFLTSAALLALEISLTRFFSYTIWYHFAYLTISVALLGFGSSGALVAAFPSFVGRRGVDLLVGSLVAAALVAATGLAFLAQFPIEIRNLMDEPLHFSASLFVYYVIVGAPFLLAGFSVSVPFAAYPSKMGRLYFWDLFGAAVGCGLVVVLIETFTVPGLVFAASGLMLASASALSLGAGRRRSGWILAAAAAVAVAAATPLGHALPIHITASKSLDVVDPDQPTRSLLYEGTDRFSKWTAINRVDASGWARPSTHSFWGEIGLSPHWKGVKPPVARLTYDGSNGSDIYLVGDVERDFEMFEHHVLALPYLLLEEPNVLVIGVGGGVDVINAIKQGARHVTGAELQPETVKLLGERLREQTGGFYDRDDVTLVASEGRHYVRKSDQVFDLVQITAVDTFAAQATGAYVLAESYLYTVEAMQDYFAHLSEDGIVSCVVGDLVTEGSLEPLGTRLALLGHRALASLGVADPSRHIILVGSLSSGGAAQNEVALFRKRPYRDDEIARVKSFAAEKGFELLYAPGEPPSRLSALLGPDEDERRRILDEEWFDVEATYDSNPFFYNVGKWKNFSASKSTLYIMPGSFMGQVVLLAMVLQSVVLGTGLILLPLWRGAREGLRAPRVLSYLAYFLALGVGFMFIEISFVQSFVLFLGSPTYALSVTILALLLFAGLGSFLSSRFADAPEQALARLRIVVAVLVCAYAAGLAPMFQALLHLELWLRIAIAVAVQIPIGITLGMFMPLGIALVARENARLVPWAWGINGVGSVVGTTLAVLLAMAAGFPAVSLTAVALYLIGTTLLIRARPAA